MYPRRYLWASFVRSDAMAVHAFAAGYDSNADA
jgi:hypothetical protein